MRRQIFTLGSTVLMLCALLATTARADHAEPRPRLHVSGEGSTQLAPDMAILSMTVAREAESAAAATRANSAAMAEVVAALRNAGVAERDLQTSNFAIQPRYTSSPRSSNGSRPAPRIDGYSVRNSLTVRLRDIDSVGQVLDSVIKLGVNEGGDIRFSNDNPEEALNEARRQAVRNAMQKARTLADAAGVELGDILEMNERNTTPRPMALASRSMAMSDSLESVPVAAGENSYLVTVNMVFAIEQ